MQIIALKQINTKSDDADPTTNTATHNQILHHRNRRLYTKNNSKTSLGKNWRHSPRRQQEITEEGVPVDEIRENAAAIFPISGCDLELYSAEIALGTPVQVFNLLVDTAASDLWVPSTKCFNTMCEDPDYRKYDEEASETYRPPILEGENAFEGMGSGFVSRKGSYFGGDPMVVEGEISTDLLLLGPFTIEQQAFGQATSLPPAFFDNTCGIMDGVLGLGKPFEGRGVPSVTENIASKTDYPVISFYLNAEVDDYTRRRAQEEGETVNLDQALRANPVPDAEPHGLDEEFVAVEPPPDEEDLLQGFMDDEALDEELEAEAESMNYFPSNRPNSANSELVLGGVNRQRYRDCLIWHDVINLNDQEDDQYWSVAFEKLRIRDYEAPGPIAVVDSASVLILGPVEPVTVFLMGMPAVCSVLDGEGFVTEDVPCDASWNNENGGYDLVQVPCDIDFDKVEPLRFQSGKAEYTIGIQDLFQYVEEAELCRLNILPSNSLRYFVLGTPFMKKYYTAIDIRDLKIGLAPAVSFFYDRDEDVQGGGYCEDDAYFDVSQISAMQQDGFEEYTGHAANTMQFTSAALSGDSNINKNILSSKNLYASLTFIAVAMFAVVGIFVRRRRNTHTEIEYVSDSSTGGVLQELPGMKTIEMEDWKAYDYDYEEEESMKLT